VLVLLHNLHIHIHLVRVVVEVLVVQLQEGGHILHLIHKVVRIRLPFVVHILLLVLVHNHYKVVPPEMLEEDQQVMELSILQVASAHNHILLDAVVPVDVVEGVLVEEVELHILHILDGLEQLDDAAVAAVRNRKDGDFHHNQDIQKLFQFQLLEKDHSHQEQTTEEVDQEEEFVLVEVRKDWKIADQLNKLTVAEEHEGKQQVVVEDPLSAAG